MTKFQGVGVAMVTPFLENGSIDEKGLQALTEHIIEGGVDFLVPLGTTSEAATLSSEERETVVKIIASQNHGRCPMVIGVGGNNTAQVCQDLQTLPYLKYADGVLSVTPYYNKPPQEGLYQHFSAIAKASPVPVILYNVPGRTSVNMTAATTLRIAADCPNVVAVKEASGKLDQTLAIAQGAPANFDLLSGDDSLALPIIRQGGKGIISVIANVLPAPFSELTHAAMKGDDLTADRLQHKLSALYEALFEEGNPAGVKAALMAYGIIAHQTLRLPLWTVSAPLFAKIRTLLAGF